MSDLTDYRALSAMKRGMAWQERIEVNPQVAFGKPVVAGTRIPVDMVMELVEAGYTSQQIVADFYPTLTDDDIYACICMAKEHIP
jgi:uncharacterized protein (DUF433 family)